MLRVLHLVGSPTSDFHARLSRLYAADCLAATADPSRYTTTIAHVTPDLQWRFPADLTPEALAAAPPMPLAAALAQLTTLPIDVAVPQMFCLPGMTTYRSLLDLLGIPYAGNSPAAMALTADKPKASAIVAAAGVDVPTGHVVSPGSPPPLPLPVVVKPVDSDNSLAMSLVREPTDYDRAVRLAADGSSTGTALVERYVELGREVRCGLLEQDGRLVCLPLEEYAVDQAHPVRTSDDKLATTPDGKLRLVAKTPDKAWTVDVADPLTRRVWQAARTSHAALGCRQYSLFDFRIDPSGRPWFLEASLYCSFATTSVLAVMARAAGTALPDLFDQVLAGALGTRPLPTRAPPADALGGHGTARPTKVARPAHPTRAHQPRPLTTGPAMLQHTLLHPLGAEVHDVQAHTLDDTAVTDLRVLLAQHGVVVLRHQDLDDDGLLAFLRRFGTLSFTTGETPVPGFPDLNVVSNVGMGAPPRSTFHVDTSYIDDPPAYTAMRAVTVPDRGGQTLFTDQYAAYDTLPAELRSRLTGRTVLHIVTGVQPAPGEQTSAEHPIFARHPLSGRTALYLTTPARCAAISGLSDTDAAQTITELYAHSTQPQNTLRHSWAPGDLVIWDNRCVLHRADHDGADGDRVMHRGMVTDTSTAGNRPATPSTSTPEPRHTASRLGRTTPPTSTDAQRRLR